jgi:hypothetical protein
VLSDWLLAVAIWRKSVSIEQAFASAKDLFDRNRDEISLFTTEKDLQLKLLRVAVATARV